MRCTVQRGTAVALVLLAAACGDDPVGPDPPGASRLRTVVFHRQDTGENLLLNSDGTAAGALEVPGGPALPIAVSASGFTMAVIQGSVVAVVPLDRPGQLDTAVAPRPTVPFLASFSSDAQLLALVDFGPPITVLVYDRVNRAVDTLPYEAGDQVTPVLPPVFSPDNRRIVVIGESVLSLFSTILVRDGTELPNTQRIGFSRFQTIPLFGWPRWTDDGLLMAFVREGSADPDTLLSVVIDPVDPSDDVVHERFRAVMSPVSDERPELIFGDWATYAYADDGEALVLGADPGTGGTGRHALYLVTRGVERVQLLLDDPAQRPVFPNFIN